MFQEIPTSRPSTPLLDSVDLPNQLRQLAANQLPQLARELREYLLFSVGQSGGHFGAGLGVVELTIALHYVYNTPDDILLWDVGHQAYPHKILTGRREQLPSIRTQDGLSPFPKRNESEYDSFGVGHSSTSISAALGMAIAAEKTGSNKKVAAIIGDGAMTAGQAFEALNHAGHTDTDMLVILNDNDMSISENVGGLNKYLAKLLSSKTYNSMREGSRKVLSTIPHVWELASKTEEHVKGFFTPGIFFEELGFNYIGPVDGHDLEALVRTLRNMRDLKGPQFLHIVTKKGKGFEPAEKDPIKYHALSPVGASSKKAKTFSNIFGKWACDTATLDSKFMAITPAMREGSDLVKFSEKFPDRYFDVAIAEQHAVTLAAGMACEGAKPVVAIYSTFLQRAYDQLVHDVALQNLDVTFAIDRAGVVGADGPTHAGAYDISFMRCIPNMVIACPSDETECRLLLNSAYQFNGPAAVRYPRGNASDVEVTITTETLAIGKGNVIQQGQDIAILCFGPLLKEAKLAVDAIAKESGKRITLVDMRFVKPIDEALLKTISEHHQHVITVEDNAIMGGAGSAVLEFYSQENIAINVVTLGIPDTYIEHASQAQQWSQMGLDSTGIINAVQSLS
ncbi:1-deoxy-D-xylulose-5-phosphate synthase [Bermanella sp. WJH001]|uniref:1-deoxy-D-xylulose-5-phosphate synthase n=1 Tax=Bermanella sp. WJH001 TaxID=3048005 RepID=UPI0024BE7A21|nr:1-deoxy-D-xylulose-5-phosphate synthase [Bermanella sp. WJH001]MDJ1539179.1 1-deoxy-D-xylulose-5-phosphate synthase [Bermanella sp. WJH001]